MNSPSSASENIQSSGLDRLLEQFEEAWEKGASPRLEDFLRPLLTEDPDPARLDVLREMIRIAFEYRWRRAGSAPGRSPDQFLEDYVQRYPELRRAEPLLLELISEEYRARHRWGDRPANAEYANRFASCWPTLKPILDQVAADLVAEFGTGNTLGEKTPPGCGADERPAVPLRSVADLAEAIAAGQLLSSFQRDELTRSIQARFREPRALARELLQRGWVTPFQVNQLMQGRGRDLSVGPYILLERLGEGGAGQVFKARHQKMNRVVALKLLRKELLADPEVVGRFYREIQVVSQLDHPNVVHAYDAGPAGSTHFLAMEYVEGTDLGKLVKQGGPLPVEQACEYSRQAACGLAHAHERGLVHRDIKPHNLILSLKEALIKVTDLGLARLVRPANEGATAVLTGGVKSTGTLTPENAALVGTLDYLSPEQALDFHSADIRSDIYSLGCTFYYLLTGQAPFAGGTLAEKLMRHQQAKPPGLEQFRSDVPSGVLRVLHKMLAKRPGDRYQTPGEVAVALASLHGGRAVSQPNRSAPAREKRWRVPAALIAVLLLGVTVFLMVKWVPVPPPRTNPDPSLSPLAKLKREDIPPGELDGLPAEVVAVLGRRSDKEDLTNVTAVAISPDGKRLAWPENQNHSIHLWNAETRKEADGLPRSTPSRVHCLAFSPDGKALALGSNGKAELWHIAGATPQLFVHDPEVRALAFSPDGKTLATGGGKTLELWDLSTGKNKSLAQEGKVAVRSLAFSPDGKTLAVGLWQYEPVKLYELGRAPKLRDTLPAALFPVLFAPNGKWLATSGPAGGPGQVVLWDSKTKPYQRRNLGLSKGEHHLAFHPGGNYLAAAGERQLDIWDLSPPTPTNRTIGPFRSSIGGVAYAPDGHHLVTANADGTVYIFRVSAP